MSVEARVRRSDGSIHTVGRIALQYRAWEIAQPRAVMLVLHGLGEHSGRYEQLGTTMAGYGFSSFALDLRGPGASEGRRGYARNFGVLLQDVDRFRREIEGSAAPGVPFFLLGHSMGGLIALRYLQEYQGMFLGGIISAPWLANALNIPRWKITMAAALARVFPALPLSNGLDPDDLC
ncbi:MAG: alpha/beta hydrolase, partial [Gemmatimonadetes bacterium]|nr:alpha/beta hydrolase [Gemmatimonadota bacterium]